MFVEGGWERPKEPPPPERRVSDRDERVMLWLIVAFAVLMLVAPIGGGTIVQPILAALAGQ